VRVEELEVVEARALVVEVGPQHVVQGGASNRHGEAP
jgi:hypothetical protein